MLKEKDFVRIGLARVAVMLIAPLNLRGDRLDTISCSLMESGTCQP